VPLDDEARTPTALNVRGSGSNHDKERWIPLGGCRFGNRYSNSDSSTRPARTQILSLFSVFTWYTSTVAVTRLLLCYWTGDKSGNIAFGARANWGLLF
jgi:hypothetical protein